MDARVGLWRKLSVEEFDTFELWCWRRLLRVPWTARRSNRSILKEISPEISLEGIMLRLKLQYFGHLMRRVDSLEKTLTLGGIGGRRKRGWQRTRWLDDITDSIDLSLSELREWWWTGRPGVLRFMGSQRVGHGWTTELNWTEKGEGFLKLKDWERLLLLFTNQRHLNIHDTINFENSLSLTATPLKEEGGKILCPRLPIYLAQKTQPPKLSNEFLSRAVLSLIWEPSKKR